MTNVLVTSFELVGEKIIEASQSDQALRSLIADPETYFEGAMKLNGQVLVIHVNTDEVTHLTIPSGTQVGEMLSKVEGGNYGYPDGYTDIDPSEEPKKAYNFRVGDYSFAQCG